MSEKHPDFEIKPVNTIRPLEIEYTQTPQALVPIDTPLSIIHKHIPRQSGIDKIVKNIETCVIHSLKLLIQAQDLIKAYQHSTHFCDIYQYIIDTIPIKYREYYNLLLARAQLVGNMLLEWRTKQVLEYESKIKKFRNEEIFQDNQMVYLLAPHASALQMNTTKFKQDFIGPLFIDTALDKTHYRLKDMTGLLLDSTYHMNRIKKGSAHTPLGIVDKFDTYETALKNTLLNKFTIETPNNKLQEVTLQDGSKELNYLPGTIMDYASLQS